jgi:hypothetical protein
MSSVKVAANVDPAFLFLFLLVPSAASYVLSNVPDIQVGQTINQFSILGMKSRLNY